jgi:PII-like signaling protein
MIKDIPNLKVEDVALAVVQEEGDEGAMIWNVYLINMKNEGLYGVLVSSRGYGLYEGKEVKTSTLRHFVEDLPANSYVKVEPIIDKLFGLNNEFWLSFYVNGVIYDKKYVFLPETIKPEYFINLPLINKKGVMIK